LELLLAVGIDAIAERVLHLTDYLCERCRRGGVTVYSSRLPGEASGIVSLVIDGEVRALKERCREADIVVNQRAGRLRVSPHAYNTTEELDRLVALIGAAS
jgi:selenocysteine lyase/cysteine desulfurase